MKLPILFATLLSVSSVISAAEDDVFIGSVPRVIFDQMKKHGCEPIDNFYDDYLVDQPPFLRLHAVADIFVCQTGKKGSIEGYKLVFRISDFRYHRSGKYHNWYEFRDCPPVIETKHKLGGLSISRSDKIIGGEKKNFLTLTIGKDGGFTDYVCHKSKWHTSSYH